MLHWIQRILVQIHPPFSPIGSWMIYRPCNGSCTGDGYNTAPTPHRVAALADVRLVQVMRVFLIQQVSPLIISPLHAVLPSSLMSASGRPRCRSGKNELFAPVCIPAPPVWQLLHRQPALRKPRPAFTAHASARISSSSLSSSRTSSAGNTRRARPRSLPAASSPPGCGARFLPLAVLCLDPDERREASRSYTVWIRVVSVCTVVSLSPSTRTMSPPVYATATSIPSGHPATPHPFRHSPSQRVVEVAASTSGSPCCIRV